MEAIVGDSIGIRSPIPTKAPDSQPPVVEVAESFDFGVGVGGGWGARKQMCVP